MKLYIKHYERYTIITRVALFVNKDNKLLYDGFG